MQPPANTRTARAKPHCKAINQRSLCARLSCACSSSARMASRRASVARCSCCTLVRLWPKASNCARVSSSSGGGAAAACGADAVNTAASTGSGMSMRRRGPLRATPVPAAAGALVFEGFAGLAGLPSFGPLRVGFVGAEPVLAAAGADATIGLGLGLRAAAAAGAAVAATSSGAASGASRATGLASDVASAARKAGEKLRATLSVAAGLSST